nr:MAG TPA_asm: hypothetical protein [Caudoviricetes sp.]
MNKSNIPLSTAQNSENRPKAVKLFSNVTM